MVGGNSWFTDGSAILAPSLGAPHYTAIYTVLPERRTTCKTEPPLNTSHDQPLMGATPPGYTVAQIVYALHTLAIVIGIVGAPTVVGSFVGSVPSIIAVILNYLNRSEAYGTWVESHYRWQIRTFWFAVLWVIIAAFLIFTFVGAPLGFIALGILTVWLIYRIARGWVRLRDRQAMYVYT